VTSSRLPLQGSSWNLSVLAAQRAKNPEPEAKGGGESGTAGQSGLCRRRADACLKHHCYERCD
jgi:hypothetical protein